MPLRQHHQLVNQAATNVVDAFRLLAEADVQLHHAYDVLHAHLKEIKQQAHQSHSEEEEQQLKEDIRETYRTFELRLKQIDSYVQNLNQGFNASLAVLHEHDQITSATPATHPLATKTK